MIVLFGSTGDLAKRKLIPALYRLQGRGDLDERAPIVCLGRASFSTKEYVKQLELDRFIDGLDESGEKRLIGSLVYCPFDMNNATPTEFADLLTSIAERVGCSLDILFYLALPTRLFGEAASLIQPLLDVPGWKRVVFEKPFGENLSSAERLNERISEVLSEEQIYRVDHYLGKELVQNILFLRFANEIFSCAWNRDAIDNIQISVCESLGVEDRAAYYDRAGAVRDMLQNHLLQLLCLVAMEPPISGHGNAVRDESSRVLARLRIPVAEDVVLGQYQGGSVAGKNVCGYREERGVAEKSSTETFVALRAFIDSDRWRGVPFYLRTGKRLRSRYAEINITFRQKPLQGLAFQDGPNMITIRIQPDEGIALAFNVRKPGNSGATESVLMDFCHHCHFGPNTPEAYETIMSHVLKGDPLLFTRWDWLRESWYYVDALKSTGSAVVPYPAGSEGPDEADKLLKRDGRRWIGNSTASRINKPLRIERLVQNSVTKG